ncbi:MAG: hypothetical protein ACK5LC_00295, partial [Coprobacillaceae bacterium]
DYNDIWIDNKIEYNQFDNSIILKKAIAITNYNDGGAIKIEKTTIYFDGSEPEIIDEYPTAIFVRYLQKL